MTKIYNSLVTLYTGWIFHTVLEYKHDYASSEWIWTEIPKMGIYSNINIVKGWTELLSLSSNQTWDIWPEGTTSPGNISHNKRYEPDLNSEPGDLQWSDLTTMINTSEITWNTFMNTKLNILQELKIPFTFIRCSEVLFIRWNQFETELFDLHHLI